jgi:hypothetical protein
MACQPLPYLSCNLRFSISRYYKRKHAHKKGILSTVNLFPFGGVLAKTHSPDLSYLDVMADGHK